MVVVMVILLGVVVVSYPPSDRLDVCLHAPQFRGASALGSEESSPKLPRPQRVVAGQELQVAELHLQLLATARGLIHRQMHCERTVEVRGRSVHDREGIRRARARERVDDPDRGTGDVAWDEDEILVLRHSLHADAQASRFSERRINLLHGLQGAVLGVRLCRDHAVGEEVGDRGGLPRHRVRGPAGKKSSEGSLPLTGLRPTGWPTCAAPPSRRPQRNQVRSRR